MDTSTLIPAEPVRAHVNLLRRAGGTYGRVSELAGVPKSTLTCMRSQITVGAAQRILSVTPDDVQPDRDELDLDVLHALLAGRHVDFPHPGTKDPYVWALHERGWPSHKIMAVVGASATSIRKILSKEPPVDATTRDAYDAYNRIAHDLETAEHSVALWKEAHQAAMQREESWRDIALTTQAVLNDVVEYVKKLRSYEVCNNLSVANDLDRIILKRDT